RASRSAANDRVRSRLSARLRLAPKRWRHPQTERNSGGETKRGKRNRGGCDLSARPSRGVHGGLCPRANTDLLIDVPEVYLYRGLGDEQCPSDFLVCETATEEVIDLPLSGRQGASPWRLATRDSDASAFGDCFIPGGAKNLDKM